MKATLQRFADRATEEGLLDVAYATADSLGPLLLATTPRGLVRVGLPNQDADQLLVDLAERVSPASSRPPPALTRPGASWTSTSTASSSTSTCRSTGS